MNATSESRPGGRLWWAKPWCWESGLRARDVRNGRIANLMCLAWAICYLGATALVAFLHPPVPIAVMVVIVPVVASLFALRAYTRFLREADELLRKIHLEGLAFGAGAALAVGTAFLIVIPLGVSAMWGLTLTLSTLTIGYAIRVAAASRDHIA